MNSKLISDMLFYSENFLFQALCMLVTSGCIVFFLYRRFSQFITYDKEPLLLYAAPKRGLLTQNTRTSIKTGLFIEDFIQFNIINNEFIADLVIWFQFNPSIITLPTIELFSFDKGEILKRLPPEIKFIHDELFVQYALRLKFSTSLNHKAFPLEGHRIYIVLDNTFINSDDIIFVAYDSGFSWSEGVYVDDWAPIDRDVKTGYIVEQYEKNTPEAVLNHPRVVFSIDFARRGQRNAFVIMLPIVLIFYIGFFTFTLNHADPSQIALVNALALTSLPAIIAYAFIIATVSPRVGYFTLLDRFYVLFLIASFIVTIIHIYAVQVPPAYHQMAAFVRSIAFIAIQVGLIIASYYLIFRTTGNGKAKLLRSNCFARKPSNKQNEQDKFTQEVAS